MDINSLSTHFTAQPAAGKLAPLVERLGKRADVNRDGHVTSDEFSEFLAKLTASLDAEHAAKPATIPNPAHPLPATGTISAAAANVLRTVAALIEKE
jgi:hypothetical protein